MSPEVLEVSCLVPGVVDQWRSASPLAEDGGATLLSHDSMYALVAPSGDCEELLAGHSAEAGRLVSELACFVYSRRGWFAEELDPLGLRERRAGQYEIRVFCDVGGTPVPLMAMDLAPLRFSGLWSAIDQSQPSPVASALEIAVIPSLQEVRIRGESTLLGAVSCTAQPVWEASRLGSIAELLVAPPNAWEASSSEFSRMADLCALLQASGPRSMVRLQRRARGMFGLALAFAFSRLPVSLLIGLSHGDVVRRFTDMLTSGGGGFHSSLHISSWHSEADAFRYAPGYFAGGKVRGYSIDAEASPNTLVRVGLKRLNLVEDVPEAAGLNGASR